MYLQGTNREKKDLFIVAVRSSGGDTLPVNLTVIPSGQKWVFDTIYKTAFPHLYTSEVCSMNRLVLTDEDKSEYEPFESAIDTTNYFKKSKVMLCTLHAIWMAFKTDLYPILDGIEHGGVLREIICFISSSKHDCTFLSNCYTYPYNIHSYLASQLVILAIYGPSLCV